MADVSLVSAGLRETLPMADSLGTEDLGPQPIGMPRHSALEPRMKCTQKKAWYDMVPRLHGTAIYAYIDPSNHPNLYSNRHIIYHTWSVRRMC